MNTKYFIDYNNVIEKIFPSNSQHKIKGTIEEWRIRENCDTDIILNSDKGYNFIKALESSNPKLILIVKKLITGLWIERVKGYFYPKDCKFDDDKTDVIIKCQTLDDYNSLLLRQDEKINILEAPIINFDITLKLGLNTFEFITETVSGQYAVGSLHKNNITPSFFTIGLGATNLSMYSSWVIGSSGSYPNLPGTQGYQIYKIQEQIFDSNLITWNPTTHINTSTPDADAFVTWFREIRLTLNVGGIATQPSGLGWIDAGIITYGNSDYTKWVRKPIDSGIGYFQYDNVGAVTIGIGTYNPIIRDTVDQEITYNRFWRNMESVFNLMLSKLGTGLTFKSDLILSNTNPLDSSDNLYYHLDPNDLQYQRCICIAQKSDVIAINATERATLGEISIRDLLNDYSEMFNASWTIDGNFLRFENVKFFNNGLNYSAVPFNVIDIRGETKNRKKNKYSYSRENNYHREVFTFNESSNIDFKGADIKYNDFFNSDKEIVKNHNVNNFTNELEYIKLFPTEISKSGFCLAVVDFDTVNNTAEIVNYNGAITGQTLTNGLLCWSVLHSIFFKNYRYSLSGFLNNIATIFESVKPNKIQENIIIDNSLNDFSPLNRYRTELGVGEIQEYTEDIALQEITATLKHPN